MATEAMPTENRAPDIEGRILEYLLQFKGDRYLTANRISLALGLNELLVKTALKALIVSHRIFEREDTDWDVVTYHVSETSEPETILSVNRRDNTKGKENDDSKGKPKGRLAEEESSISCPKCESNDCIGNGHRQTKKGSVARYICKACGFKFSEGRVYPKVGRPRGQSQESAELDAKIKELYPTMQMDEIAVKLKEEYGTIRGRITRLRQRGEITEYSHYPSKSGSPIGKKPTKVVPMEAKAIPKPNHFNIGQLLKVNSENQVAVVNATLEVIDERGSEYEITIKRSNRGLALILSKEMLEQLIDTLEYRNEEINDISEDAQKDDPDWFQSLMEEQYLCESIIKKIRKDARIPDEKVK